MMAWLLQVLPVLILLARGGTEGTPLLAGDPYKDILSDPNFRPKPENQPNKTVDELIKDAYGGLNMYMSDNFLDMRGTIATELDMVLKPEQFRAMYMSHDRQKRKATRPLAYRWTDNTIPYEFITSHFSVDEVYYIKKAMERWMETTCLKFRPATRADRNRIRFQNGNGCNSLLGMAGGTQPINLEARGCRFSGLYLHEIGHAIGLVHEHQLPDRDQYIYIIYDNVAPSMRIWFNKYSTKDVNQYGVPYEYSSVMHYGVTAFSKDGSSQTIRAKDRSREAEIGRVYLKGLSFSDIKVVNLMYNCSKHCAADPSCKEPGYLDKNCKCVRPNGGGGTKPTKPGSCSNTWGDSQCQGWAADDECTKNPVWMAENCKKACKKCKDSGGGGKPDKCTNIWGDFKCDDWANSGECKANRDWMAENCAKACVCGKKKCVDNNQYCPSWAESGYCTTNWYTRDNCHKSCNTCGASQDETDDTTTDHTETEDENDGTTLMVSLPLTVLVAVVAFWSSL